jgi:YbbR domain-containing protein
MALRDYVFEKFGWKAISLVIASLIWMAIDSNNQTGQRSARNMVVPTLTLRLQIALLTAARDARHYQVSPATVEVTLGGSAAALERLGESDVGVFIDLRDAGDAKRLRRKVHVYPPSGLSLVGVMPDEVSVEVLPAVESPENHKTD